MSDNLANQEKSAKKSKKMESSKVTAAKAASLQETIKTVERSAETGDDERVRERERHNSAASSTHPQPVYTRTWTNGTRYSKYRGSSENRRGSNHSYSNRESFVAPSSFDPGNLCRPTSTQSLNSNVSKKIDEETVEVTSSTTSNDAANDIRLIAVNAPDSEEGNVTYIAAGTAPASRIGSLRQNANAAAFSAYAGPAPAPAWENSRVERGTRGGFPNINTPFKSPRGIDDGNRYYEKREEGGIRRDMRVSTDSNRMVNRRGVGKRSSDRSSIGDIDVDRDSSIIFFQHQNDENCRNSLVSINALAQIQQQLAESQGISQSLPRYHGDWRRRGGEREITGRGGRNTEGDTGITTTDGNETTILYPAATSKVCGMEKGEKKREDSTSNCQRDSSLPSTPNESELIFSSATSPENVSEVDRSAPISVKAFHNGIPVPPIHTEMRGDISSCVSSTSSSSLSHHSRPNIETPLIPSGGVTLTSIPTSSLTTTVSTSKHPPTVSSALPSTMVAHPQRSQEALFRPCASSSRLQYSHPPPQSSHLTSSTSNPMLHQQQPITPFLQPPPTSVNVMEQSEDGARMGINGVVSGSRKEESLSSSRSPFLSAAHPVSWSTAASGIGSGGVGGSLPPRAPPSGFVDEGGRFMISEMDYLSEEIWHFHHTMTQTESTCSRKLHLRDMLYYAICPVFPMCGLYVVGSSLNGFGNNSSDMDLCLMITNKDLDQKTDAVLVLNMILKQLVNVEWVAHQQLILAKVPILRIQFTAPFGDITVDLNANNSVAIKNTHLLCYYSSFDWRVRPLVTIVKEWAKKKGINDANRSSFTSYSLVLMVIHYLQCGVEQPVLPSLQSMYARRFSRTADVRSLNVSIPLAHPPEEWTFNETSSLGELLIGFLEYFALKFDYNQHAISVRMGRKLDRTAVVRSRAQYPQQSNNWRSQWRCVCIEEPFTFSNTAHSVYDEMVFTKIKEAFKDAYHLLESTRDLNKLMDCAPIAVPNLPHGNGAVVLMGGCHADTSVVASSSSSSLSAPHSGHASSASSSCGEEEVVVGVDKERVDASRSIPSSTHCNMKKDYSPPLQSSSHSNDRSNEQECTPVVSVNQ